MIIDEIRHAPLYRSLSPRIAAGLDFLHDTDLACLAEGRHDFDGDRVYVLVQSYLTVPPAEGRWEAHRRYIDLQHVVQGRERLGWAPIDRLQAGGYDAERDVLPLGGEGDVVTLSGGTFALLFPHDAHMPRLALAAPEPVKKIVIKIAVD